MTNIKILIISVLFFTIYFSALAQEDEYVVVKGEVVDKSLRSISYVNIISKKTGLGFISEEDGSFNIKVLKNDTLIFSTISYKRKYVSVSEMIKDKIYVTLYRQIYDLSSVNIYSFPNWTQFKKEFMEKKLKPMEQKILVIEGLPNPFMKPRPVGKSSNPITLLYQIFNKDAIRKRKQKRWNKIYEKSWISKE